MLLSFCSVHLEKHSVMWIATRICKDVNYELNLKMLYAIAFVPDNDVVFAYEELLKTPLYVQHKDEIIPLLDYYEATWICIKLRRRGRHGPCLNIDIWNHYESVLSDLYKSKITLRAGIKTSMLALLLLI